MNLKSKILEFLKGDKTYGFDELALTIFQRQARENAIYAEFLDLMAIKVEQVNEISDIPLFPIRLFKKYALKTGDWQAQTVFQSSGTSDMTDRSRHYVRDPEFYRDVCQQIFSSYYVDPEIEIIALLPSYIESGQSSLVAMVRHLAEIYNQNPGDIFYLYDHTSLMVRINEILNTTGKQVVLFGVSFALLDFAESFCLEDERLRILFTGGMKNRRKEMNYEEVYDRLKTSFPLSSVDSEYGMTEMFSQSYSIDDRQGWFKAGRTLQIFGKELYDPLSDVKIGKTAQLGFIDLANIDTLSFILTDDLVIKDEKDRFKLIGRIHKSDLRGCNLMYQS